MTRNRILRSFIESIIPTILHLRQLLIGTDLRDLRPERDARCSAAKNNGKHRYDDKLTEKFRKICPHHSISYSVHKNTSFYTKFLQ